MNEENEFRQKRYFSRLYSSKRRLKNRVLNMERSVAGSVERYLECRKLRLKNFPNLPKDLEWLLTWKLKTGCAPQVMWCDGVESLKVKSIGKYRIRLFGRAWVGPEYSDIEPEECAMYGEIEIKPSGKKLKNYWLAIEYDDSVIIARKNIKNIPTRT